VKQFAKYHISLNIRRLHIFPMRKSGKKVIFLTKANMLFDSECCKQKEIITMPLRNKFEI
jgi:hypothetical protein